MNHPDSISQAEWEEIEQYLEGNLPPDKHQLFESRLATDDALRHKVEEVRLLITGVRESALELKLFEFHEGISSTSSRGRKRDTSRVAWVAAAAILLAVLSLILLLQNGGRHEKLFAKYFEADPGLATVMGNSEQYELYHAMIDYKSGNYESAISSWRKLLASSPLNDTLHYFSGVAFLAMGQADSATSHLKQSLQEPGSSFTPEARWYLGLSLVKQKDIQGAINYLSLSEHPEKEKLLSELKLLK